MTNDIINPIEELYLDWVNNFLTIERFAEYYDISEDLAILIIREGRIINFARAGVIIA